MDLCCSPSLHLQMFEAEEDGAITESELAVILKTALGVARLSVSHLFAAIDVGDTGKITFGKRNEINPGCSLSFPLELLFSHFRTIHSVCSFLIFFASLAPPCGRLADKFRSFVEQHPEFAEDYLYTENEGLHSAPCPHHQHTSPSSPTLHHGTAKTANGICPDFSPNDHGKTDGHLKKHN